jgi:hypothetical protein
VRDLFATCGKPHNTVTQSKSVDKWPIMKCRNCTTNNAYKPLYCKQLQLLLLLLLLLPPRTSPACLRMLWQLAQSFDRGQSESDSSELPSDSTSTRHFLYVCCWPDATWSIFSATRLFWAQNSFKFVVICSLPLGSCTNERRHARTHKHPRPAERHVTRNGVARRYV